MSVNDQHKEKSHAYLVVIWLIKWVISPIFTFFVLSFLILKILSYVNINQFDQDPYLINIGYVGSSLSGVSSLISIILTLIAVYYVRKTYINDRKRNIEQDFENKFFLLINNFLNIKSNLDHNKLSDIIERVKDLNLHDAKVILRNNNHIFGDFFRNLYLLLKFVNSNKNKISKNDLDLKFYTNLIRSYLSVELTQLLAINCYIMDDEKDSNYEAYKKFIEEYSFLEHMSFLDLNRNIILPSLCAFGYYDETAFDKNIWLKSNNKLSDIYKFNSQNLILPFISYISNKSIYSEDRDKFYISKNRNNNSLSFSYLSCDQEVLYKSYCATMEYDASGSISIDDHIYGFLNFVCDDKFYHLYLEFSYSKDYDEDTEDYTMMKILIGQFSNKDFILVANMPSYHKNELSDQMIEESVLINP